MRSQREDPTDRGADGARIRFSVLSAVTLGAGGAVLLGLFAASEVTIAADGTLEESFGLLALGTLALTAAGLVGLGVLFREVRRRSTCRRDRC